MNMRPINLLSIDWDYFFPEQSHNPALMGLYDWGHRDSGKFFLEDVWVHRAMQFFAAGMELPTTSGEETSFWSRFKFSPDAKLYFADSHVHAIHPDVAEDVINVVNFDAHHDGGYNQTIGKIVKSQQVDCGSWMVGYYLKGAFVQTIYPSWKKHAMKTDGKPAIPKMARRVDTGLGAFPTFDRVFVCRSGGWSPPWLDAQFDQFLQDCPVKNGFDIGMFPRQFDVELVKTEADKLAVQMQEWRATMTANVSGVSVSS